MTMMMNGDFMMIIEPGLLLAIGLTLILGMCIGYALATRDSLMAIENVNQWIEDTKSNQWVHYEMYDKLEQKHDKLIKEYEQYRGMVMAMNDFYRKKMGD